MFYYKFSGGNGYCGCDYEEVVAFDEEPTEDELCEYSKELCYQNAEYYEYVAFGWESEGVTDEEYYNSVLDYCGYEQISYEEYMELTKD